MPRRDFQKRLSKLIYCEVNLCQREANIAKIISEHNSYRTKLQAQIFQQLEQLHNYQEEVKRYKSINTNLFEFIAEEKLAEQKSEQRMDAMKEDYRMETQGLTEKRQKLLSAMTELGCLKSLTKIFINSRHMPETICGVVIQEKETTCQLIPFKIDNLETTRQNVDQLQILGSQDGIDWNALIMGNAANPTNE